MLLRHCYQFGGVVKAYTFEDFLDYCEYIQPIIAQDLGTSSEEYIMCSRIVDNKSTIVNQIGNQIDLTQYDGWYALGTNSTHYIRFWGTKNVQSLSINQNGTANVGQRVGQFCANYNANKLNWLAGGVQQNFNQVSNVWYFGLINVESSNGYVDNCLINNQGFFNQYQYLIFNNDLPNTAYNGNILTYYFQGDFYSYSQVKIGNIQPNDSYYFELRLKDSVTGVVKGTSFVSLNTDPINIYNDGAIFVNENFDVYIVNRLLKYSTQYQLEIESYYGDGGDNLYEDIDWFMFLPQNAVVENGVITSLGSGDFTQQDNANTIIDSIVGYQEPSGDIAAFFGDYNVLSGDILEGVSMPKVAHSDDLTIFNLVRVFGETLTYSGDAYFDFSLHGEPPTRIYASQFTTPNNALKVFMSSFLVFGTFYMLMLQVRNFIELVSTANFKSAIDYIDTSLDNMFYM